MVGVGAYKNNKNASVIYVGRGFYAPDDPKMVINISLELEDMKARRLAMPSLFRKFSPTTTAESQR